MRLTDLVNQCFSADVMDRLSAATKEPSGPLQRALSAAVPAVTGILADQCDTPGGAGKLLDMIQDPRQISLDGLADQLGPEELHVPVNTGNGRLGTLIGRKGIDELARAISRFASVSVINARSLLSIVTSVSLAAIGRHVNPPSTHDLTIYMNEQHEAISAAIPAGLYEYLYESPELRSLMHHYDAGTSSTATDDAMEGESAIPRQENVHNERMYVSDERREVTSGLAWFVPVMVLLAVAAAVVFSIYPRDANHLEDRPVALSPAPAAPEAMQAMQAMPAASATPGDFQEMNLPSNPALGRQLPQLLQEFSTIVREGEPGLRANQRLQAIRDRLQAVSQESRRLPESERRLVSERINSVLPSLDTAAKRQRPAELQQLVDEILSQLRTAAQQPS